MSERELKRTSRKLDRLEKTITKALAVYGDITEHDDLVTKHLLPCGNDPILLAIKGHLLIEHLLEVDLCRILDVDHIPTGKDYGSLGFNQKLQLLRTVVEQHEPKPNADLFLAIKSLNDARNRIAHNLKSPQDVENDLNLFIREYHKQASTKPASPSPIAEELKTCILSLCRFLHDIRIHLFRLEVGAT